MVVFACQTDSFLKEFSSKVVSCTESQLKTVRNGKKETLNGYDVILEDTIIFPEGGGQPSDQGYLDDVEVLQVNRRGLEAIHFVQKPVEAGKVVKQTIDWNRRLDHMQQHSGQHLITAIFDEVFSFPTTAWWLGEESSYIELDTTSISTDQIIQVEKIVNEKICMGNSVTVKVYEEGDPSLTEVRTRGLPDDHKGAVRIVTIEGVESNMCCGTHVTNLGQLQMVKLLFAEKGKKNKTNLHFLVGGRVLKQLTNCLEREKQMTALLKNGPPSHVDLVDKLQKSAKVTNKYMQTLLREIATSEARKVKEEQLEFYQVHKKEADVDFINTFLNEVNDESVFLLLTVGEQPGTKQLTLSGKPEVVAHLGPKICEILDGKGATKGSRFSGKINNTSVKKLLEAQAVATEYLASIKANCDTGLNMAASAETHT